jgi:hypothetical protein
VLAESITEDPLRLAVHRGKVEEGNVAIEGCANDLVACLLLASARVEHLLGTQAH